MEKLRADIKTALIKGVIYYHPPAWDEGSRSWYLNFDGVLLLESGSLSLFQAGFPGQPISLIRCEHSSTLSADGETHMTFDGRVKLYRLQHGKPLLLQLFATLDNGLSVIMSAPIHWTAREKRVAS